jgi:hypothetical protein
MMQHISDVVTSLKVKKGKQKHANKGKKSNPRKVHLFLTGKTTAQLYMMLSGADRNC